MKKIMCPECGSEMELYGVFDTGELKFWCPDCSRILDKIESNKLGLRKEEWLNGK